VADVPRLEITRDEKRIAQRGLAVAATGEADLDG
jgi:hypothetical protein